MPKDKHHKTILAIRPGRREMGIAVFSGGELRYWGVTRFRQKELNDLLSALEQRLLRLIRLYRPAVLAVEKPTTARLNASPWLGEIATCIRAVARASELQVQTFGSVSVRRRLCGSVRATRRDLAQRITQTYPHLSRYNAASGRWRNEYWMQMFAAVAVGMVCGER